MDLEVRFGKYKFVSKSYDEETVKVMNLKKDKYFDKGAFIYSLSKIYMYKNAYGPKFSYTDTDSNKSVSPEQERLIRELHGHKVMKDLVFPEIYNNPCFEYKDKPLFYESGLKCCG